MALIWADGFDHYGTEENLKLIYQSRTATPLLSTDDPRTGTNCIRIWVDNEFRVNFQSQLSLTMIASAAMKMDVPPPSNPDRYGWQIFQVGSIAVEFRILPDGGITCWVHGIQVASAPANTFVFGSWNSFQWKILFHNTAGFVQLRKNGSDTDLFLATNLATGETPFDQLYFGYQRSSATNVMYVDDLVVMDNAGAFDNDFIGDPRCRTRLMNANGPVQDFMSLSGAAAYSEIAHVPPDATQFAIQSDVVGDVSNFAMEAIPDNTAFVAGVFMFAQALKSDTGACNMKMGIVSSGVQSDTVDINPGTTAGYYYGAVDHDPATGGYFTKEAAQAMMWQIERDG